MVQQQGSHVLSIHTSTGCNMCLGFPTWQASAEHARKQQELMREIELRRKMKATVVPTADGEVRRMLRQLGEPITLFGEREVRRGGAQGAAHGWHLGWRVCLQEGG